MFAGDEDLSSRDRAALIRYCVLLQKCLERLEACVAKRQRVELIVRPDVPDYQVIGEHLRALECRETLCNVLRCRVLSARARIYSRLLYATVSNLILKLSSVFVREPNRAESRAIDAHALLHHSVDFVPYRRRLSHTVTARPIRRDTDTK